MFLVKPEQLAVKNSTYSLLGQNCVITGATSGIGRAAAYALASTGANLYLTGRRESAGRQLVQDLRKCSPGRIEFLPTDLSDQSQVRALAGHIKTQFAAIDVLINNAGARFNEFHQSRDCIELTFATNHLGHFLLTSLLLGALLEARRARIITVGSGAHGGISSTGDWCLTQKNYDRKLAYGKSKLANIMFAYELSRRLKGTRAVSNAVDPGGVATNLGRNNGLLSWMRHLVYYAIKAQLISAQRGAETIFYLAADGSAQEFSGNYFYQKRVIESSAASHDLAAASRLWSLSLQLAPLSRVEQKTLPACAA